VQRLAEHFAAAEEARRPQIDGLDDQLRPFKNDDREGSVFNDVAEANALCGQEPVLVVEFG
jgi:hypothetical protein